MLQACMSGQDHSGGQSGGVAEWRSGIIEGAEREGHRVAGVV